MSHVCGKASSDKILNVFNKQVKPTDKHRCSVNRFTANCKCLKHYAKTDGHHKMKRLRSRKERSQMRGGGKEASKSKSHHQHCQRQNSKDIVFYQNCCHSGCHCPSRRDVPFPNIIPVTQEPSVITDSRLIGHHGLFNHEVKSIDIERLLSEQRKREKSGQQEDESNNATSHPSTSSHIPSPFSSNYLLGAGTDELLPLEKKTAHDKKRQKKERKTCQGSDITPGQRPQQHPGLSSESLKSISSSKPSSLDVVILKTNPDVSEKGRDLQLTPTVVRGHAKTSNRKVKRLSTPEHTPKKPCSETPIQQIQDLSPSPLQVSSSHTANSFDSQHREQDPESVSKSVSAVAAGLCDSLQLPLLRRRNLVAESRQVLLRALREKHGPRLQQNLLEVQRCLSFGFANDPANEVQVQEPTMINELSTPDAFTTVFQTDADSHPCFDTQKTTTFRITGSKCFNWKSRPQPRQNQEQTPEWLKSPVETSVCILDDVLRPTFDPNFCMDFEPSGDTASDRLLSPTSCWGKRPSASQHREDSLNRQRGKEAGMLDSFENSFMDFTRAVPEKSTGSQLSGSNIQPLFSFQTQLPDRCSAEPMHFPLAKGSVEPGRYSFAPSFSNQIHHPQQGFQSFTQLSLPSTCPPLRSHHTDMIDYPPSHMLERDPAAPRSSFPSPEHWSFPPMRLY